ncbi:MAG TPA: CotH kinase family protein [Solirubrobacterales bacterium]|nr:CotH kinase family protein [Solirubrobacterales bacterium]
MISRIAIALACLASLLAIPAIAGADEIEWMYDPDAVVEIRLGGLSEAELDALELDPTEEQEGTFELLVDGVPKGPLLNDVGIRLKGGVGSGRPVKTSKSGFKVRFDEFVDDQLFFGIKRLTLNSMIQDPSMVHESLTYKIFRTLGLPASRTGYAFVTLNGADYGLFLNLETLDEISLPQWFATTQHLYEADKAKTDVVPGAPPFEVDEGDDEEISDLEKLIAAVNDPEGDWSDNVSPFADLEQMTAHWAVERYVSHWDGYAGEAGEFRPNNYYLHSDAAGVFQMMPWGTDQTWEFNIDFDEPAGGVMFNKCLADASCKQLYLDGLTDLYCVAPGLDLPAQAAQLATMLAPYQDREDPVKREATEEKIAEAVEDFEALATERPQELEDYLTAEGVLADGVDPCLQSPPPGKPTVIPSLESPPATMAQIGKLRRKGAVVLTNLHVTGSAKATQRVFTRIDGKRRGLCTDQSERIGAGRLIVRCRLPEWALERLEDGPLKLKARIGFFPELGTSRTAIRRLTAPRR